MELYDQHVHSRHSFDSKADPAANVERAIQRGLAGLTFTEHFDTHPDEWSRCVYDDASYTATIRRLRRRYGDAIFIGKGIEVCYQPDRMAFIRDFLERHEFDLVILSVHHFARGGPVHQREPWGNMDAAAGTRAYLENVLDAVRCCERLSKRGARVFDVLGHLDFIKRYSRRFFEAAPPTPADQLMDDILAACLAAGLTPEINTSTLRQGLSETMPGPTTVTRYAALGGTSLSLGSDAHKSEDVGADLDRAARMLREAGLGHTAVFQRRERREVPLDR